MTTALDLRQYRPADDDRVRELHETALRAAGGFIEGVPEPDLDAVEKTYLTDGDFLVGEIDDRIVAMGAFRPATGHITEVLDCSGTTAELKRLRVDPVHQRNGYGQAVCEEVERRAREQGFTEIVLDTTPAQTGARRFFETNGFEQVRTERRRWEGDPFELLFYRKSLVDGASFTANTRLRPDRRTNRRRR